MELSVLHMLYQAMKVRKSVSGIIKSSFSKLYLSIKTLQISALPAESIFGTPRHMHFHGMKFWQRGWEILCANQ